MGRQRIVNQYVNGVYAGTRHVCTITRYDGTEVKLTHFYDGIAAIGETMATQVAKLQVPLAMAALQDGHTLPYGTFAVGEAGVTVGRRGVLPWHELAKVDVFQGQVRLYKAGKRLPWAHQAAHDTPNLLVFLTVAESKRRSSAPRS
jgi:hypothetical protein